MRTRVLYLGSSDQVAERLAQITGAAVERALPATLDDGDIAFLQGYASGGAEPALATLPGGNAFAACRAIKASSRARVYVLVRRGDAVSQEIARFCLADGVVEVDGDQLVSDPRDLATRLSPHRRRVSVEALLQRLEQEMANDEGRQASALRKLLRPTPSGGILTHLTDPETGLFDGPYAALKIDEEFKRAVRFHQPLALILLDIGAKDGLPADAATRRTLLAEVAGVFLNECRDIDVLARFTESIFLFLLPGTGSEGAGVVCRRMLAALRERSFAGGVRLDPHAGLVTVPAAGIANREAFLVRAEACLLLAKEGQGEDGICADRD
ncbi:MAG TPA: GGDEF domain-containing protein [Planctomycetota bacterium]|nr:GGDEF domain-containing protein [Planctomycetota bacterium]